MRNTPHCGGTSRPAPCRMKIRALVFVFLALARLHAVAPVDLPGAPMALTLDHKTQYVDTQIDGYFFRTEPAGELAVFVIRGYQSDPARIKGVYVSGTWENKDSITLTAPSPALTRLLELLKTARVAPGADRADLSSLERDLRKERE